MRCAVALRVLLPGQVVQEHPHRRHPEALGPPEFLVNRGRVERVGLPHLELVDGGCRDVVAADEPRLRGVPLRGLLFGPASGGRSRLRETHDGAEGDQEGRETSAVHAVSTRLRRYGILQSTPPRDNEIIEIAAHKAPHRGQTPLTMAW